MLQTSEPYDAPRPYDDPVTTYDGLYAGVVWPPAVEGSIYDEALPYDDPLTSYDGYAVGTATPPALFAGLEAFYVVGEFALACYVLPVSDGMPFEMVGILDTVDEADFGAPAVTTHTLRYPMGQPLRTGDRIFIAQTAYTVAGLPQRINTQEMRAHLTRQA